MVRALRMRPSLPRQDLNLEWLDQNQLCYQLHHGVRRQQLNLLVF